MTSDGREGGMDIDEKGVNGEGIEDRSSTNNKFRWRRGGQYLIILVLSTAIHALILMTLCLIPTRQSKAPPKRVVVLTYHDEPDPIEERPVIVSQDKNLTPVEPVSESEPDDSPSEKLDDLPDLDENPEVDPQTLAQPQLAMGLNAVPKALGIAAGFTGHSGNLPSSYKSRGKGKARAIRKYKGSPATQTAVEAALRWLMSHQEPGGYWDTFKYDGGNDRHTHHRYRHSHDRISATAVALLAFFGNGYSEVSGSPEYRRKIKRGIRWINRELSKEMRSGEFAQLQPSGHLDGNRYMLYSRAILLQCLAEASALGSSGHTRYLANKLADFFIKAYYQKQEGQGWGYAGSGFDLSLSGWVGLGLKAAKEAKLEAMDDEIFDMLIEDYSEWISTMTDPKTGTGVYFPGDAPRDSMTWVGMFQRQFLGFGGRDPFLGKSAIHLQKQTPRLIADEPEEPYEIYYATLAAFNQQGKTWGNWNKYMKKCLISSQRKGNSDTLGGSWDPRGDEMSRHGGRVMVTAIYTLCLEVYYRFEKFN